MDLKLIQSIAKRRSYYNINKEIPVSDQTIIDLVDRVTELVPDSFNMKSARVVIALGEQHDRLWDTIYALFDGKVSREKIDGFKAGYGTILYFYDNEVVQDLQERFPTYADKFPFWSIQANGMLQFSMWSSLRELNIGASLQHYNPVIDQAVKDLFDLPPSWILNAQMPFGGIVTEPEAKPGETIRDRVRIAH